MMVPHPQMELPLRVRLERLDDNSSLSARGDDSQDSLWDLLSSQVQALREELKQTVSHEIDGCFRFATSFGRRSSEDQQDNQQPQCQSTEQGKWATTPQPTNGGHLATPSQDSPTAASVFSSEDSVSSVSELDGTSIDCVKGELGHASRVVRAVDSPTGVGLPVADRGAPQRRSSDVPAPSRPADFATPRDVFSLETADLGLQLPSPLR